LWTAAEWTGALKKLLITDVDNTLLDWQHLWFETFSAMARRVLEISKVDADRFYAECADLFANVPPRSGP
jgi:hypothetical protein